MRIRAADLFVMLALTACKPYTAPPKAKPPVVDSTVKPWQPFSHHPKHPKKPRPTKPDSATSPLTEES